MYFVGVDLAWSTNNGTGIAIMKNNKYLKSGVVNSDEEIIDFLNSNVGDKNAIVTVDAPLIVPNESGRRKAEDLVSQKFRKYHAGAHPANRKRLAKWDGSIRGEVISKLLKKNGFKHSPYIKKHEKARKFFEVYPHPSMVVLFNLDRILKYKSKPNRDYSTRWEELSKYQEKLKEKKIGLPKEIADKKLEGVRGKGLKQFEDILDAIFCAYIGYYQWKYPHKCEVLGNMKEGYISTPVFTN